jgi:hypothetical protein
MSFRMSQRENRRTGFDKICCLGCIIPSLCKSHTGFHVYIRAWFMSDVTDVTTGCIGIRHRYISVTCN